MARQTPAEHPRGLGCACGLPPMPPAQASYTWVELVEISMTRHTLADIHAALGDDSDLPPMLTLHEVTVKLPAYQVAMLQALANMDSLPLDEALQRLLRIVAGEVGVEI